MEKSVALFHIDRKEYHLALNTAPVWDDRQCWEDDFDEQESDSIQDIIQILEDQTGKLNALV